MLRVLFLCTGNSCRSQMAQAWTNHIHKGKIIAFSAGIRPEKQIMPLTIKVMREAGLDISDQRPKHLDVFKNESFDYVITLCDRARESCPVYWGKAVKIHAGFDDPLTLAESAASQEEALAHYRRVRDEIKNFVMKMPELLPGTRQ
ncbi:MAG: arsenate reductase ArsC [Elusimicrobia bacterium]|nr:arsenate reductase ArsC [Elusimicrobiota bacterium]